MYRFAVCVLLSLLCLSVKADTPANCTLDDLHGTWHIYVYKGGYDKHIDCSNPGAVQHRLTFTFSGVDTVVMDSTGANGHFNLVYNQGFEAIVDFRKFFAFFAWKQTDAKHTEYWCNHTMTGWSHDVLGNDWACFTAIKHATDMKHYQIYNRGVIVKNSDSFPERNALLDERYEIDKSFVERINKVQNSWNAGYYPEMMKMTYRDILMRSGYGNGPITKPNIPRKLKFVSDYVRNKLPESFDWRNVNGQNFVPPVRNQGQCGSCYAFASMEMLACRIRVMTNNTQKPVFSPQDIMSCSQYSQGCAGGFPYLIAGKYAQDFGVIEESCFPYKANDTQPCPKTTCQRTYVAEYGYIGGYYGASTETNMMEALVANGPIVVGIEVYPDLQLYKGGIYHHVTKTGPGLPFHFGDFDPFQLTNHAVLIVGYGADSITGEKYWSVKNSWGVEWGEKGYFRIRKGTDEVAIESLAMQSKPIPHIKGD